jgi:outer membrane protein assembly factor BamD (BamD/ComL family)
MTCQQCGESIPESQSFCIKCGAPAGNAAHAAASGSAPTAEPPLVFMPYTQGENVYVSSIATDSHRQPNKKKTLRTVLIIVGAAVVVAAAVLIPVLLEKARSDRFDAAVAMMDAGDYRDAKAEFTELGDYKQSADLADECQDTMEYQSAQAQMDAGAYEEARQVFAQLGSFENASDLALECQNTLDYNAASALMEAGSIAQARDGFLVLGSFQDAPAHAAECQNQLDYDAAVSLMDEGSYEAAKTAFEELSGYSDATPLAVECGKHIKYIQAEDAFAQGQFYTAHALFNGIGSFLDAPERAEACKQPAPDNGELYRNPDFGSKKVPITIKVGDQEMSMYMKIYSEGDALVSTVYIAANSKTKIKLPAGKYRIKAAYGYDWFGEEEMFGDLAYYEVLVFDDGEYTAFSSKYIYTLSFLMDTGEGNIDSLPENREGF